MTYTIDGAKRWKPEVTEVRGGALELSVVCPSCGRDLQLGLQPPPWQVPHPDELDADGNVDEDRRGAGEITHIDQAEVRTEVWCHRDQIGADVTIRETREG